jgi:hypothetical protein
MTILSGPAVYPQSLSGIRFLANPVPYDPTLQTYIEGEFNLLRHQAKILLVALKNEDTERLKRDLVDYKLAVRNYLKIVSKELYLHLRHGLSETDPRRNEFLRFEQHTYTLIKLIAGFLRQCDLIPAEDGARLKSIIFRIDQLLISRYREEDKILWPMYELKPA